MSTPQIRPVALKHPLSIPDLSLSDDTDRLYELEKLVTRLEAEIADLKFIVSMLQKQLQRES